MKKITLHTYEAYLLDYSEGNLTTAEIQELEVFLAQHKELEIDLKDLSFPTLDRTDSNAEFKLELKRENKPVSEEELFDYLEGNFSGNEKSDLESRLREDHRMAKELEKYQKTFLSPDAAIMYSSKSHLFKQEDELILNNVAIAYLENDLSAQDRKEFESRLSTDAILKNEFHLFQKTVLVPDEAIIFEAKETLKKESKVFFLFDRRVLTSMAAAVFLILALMVVFSVFLKVDTELPKLSDIHVKENSKVKASEKKNETAVIPSTIVKDGTQTSKTVSQKKTSTEVLVSATLNTKEPASDTTTFKGIVATTIEEKTTLPSEINFKEKPENSELSEENKRAIAEAIKSDLTKLTSLPEVEDEEETVVSNELVSKYAIWKRAVRIAKRVNDLGLKSVNGNTKNNDQYLLSFNSFSIEKK